MLEKDRNELFRLPTEEGFSPDGLPEEEIAFRKLLADFTREPENKETLLQLSRMLMARRLFDEAELYLERYLKLDPDHPEVLNWQGIVHFSRGAYDPARSCFEKALEADPEHADTLYNLAMLHAAQGTFQEARACLTRFMEKEPGNAEAANNLGALCYEAGDLEEAEQWFRAALDRDPGYGAAMENLLQVLREQGRAREAEPLLAAFRALTDAEEAARITGPAAGSPNEPVSSAPEPENGWESAPSREGFTVGIFGDWCPGDRGETAQWIYRSLERHGYVPHVFASTGAVPHCEGHDRYTYPWVMGRWALPRVTYCMDLPPSRDRFEAWLDDTAPRAVIFVDRWDPGFAAAARDRGAAVLACPTLVGWKEEAPPSFDAYDGVITPSPWITRVLEDRVPGTRLMPCDAGLDLETFTPFSYKGQGVTFLLDAGQGSVESMENLLVVLQAFARVKPEVREKSRLRIRTGVPWDRYPEEIRKHAEGNPRVEVISGYVPDHWFLNMGRVYVHPAAAPGLHWLVPAAAACGTPVLVTEGAPATGWIFDEHMMLKIPRAPNRRPAVMETNTLAETFSTLAGDPEMVEYMGSVCREEACRLLDAETRGKALCDKVAACVASAGAPGKGEPAEPHHARAEEDSAPEEILARIEEAITEGKNDEARTLIARYRHVRG